MYLKVGTSFNKTCIFFFTLQASFERIGVSNVFGSSWSSWTDELKYNTWPGMYDEKKKRQGYHD